METEPEEQAPDAENQEEDLIENAYMFLTSNTYPKRCSDNLKHVIQRKAAKFAVNDGELFYKQKRKEKVASTKAKLQRKRRLFVSVLKEMRAENQPYCLDTCEDNTRVWTEQLDRGGLYHINPQV